MDWIDLSYLAGVSLAGAGARALRRGLPAGWRLRLEAAPPEDLPPGWIWLHAVSMGELILADGLIGWFRDQGFRIHVTTGTPAGMELMAKRLGGWDRDTGRVSGGAFPVDDRPGLEAFLRCPPGAFVALETELWPNLLRELEALGIPRIIVNGRLTARSLERGGPWMRRAAARLSLVAARDPESARRFTQLGAPNVQLGGNLKADLPAPAPLHEGWETLRAAWEGHPILVAGNTVEGEEELILALWRRMRESCPGLRMILAPRQPRRFPLVGSLFSSAGLHFHRASAIWPQAATVWSEVDVLLLDTLGELPLAYREGTVALVGGGWTWHGGHNPLEPVRWGLPTLIGPGYENFQDLVEPLLAEDFLRVVPAQELAEALGKALAQTPLRPGFRQDPPPLPEALRGALGRTCSILKKFLLIDR
jgi:3-deoxy-D-manno-octulosonic-acid transferase